MQRSISDSVLASAPSICCSSAALASIVALAVACTCNQSSSLGANCSQTIARAIVCRGSSCNCIDGMASSMRPQSRDGCFTETPRQVLRLCRPCVDLLNYAQVKPAQRSYAHLRLAHPFPSATGSCSCDGRPCKRCQEAVATRQSGHLHVPEAPGGSRPPGITAAKMWCQAEDLGNHWPPPDTTS